MQKYLFLFFYELLAITFSLFLSLHYISRVNKTYLPIPARDLSLKQAWFLVIFDLIVSISILWLMNADLITTSLAFLFYFFGTLYSAPPFRFKRSSTATLIVLPLVLLLFSSHPLNLVANIFSIDKVH